MIPVLFQLGPFPVHSFGLMMVLGFLAAWCCLYQQLKAAGEDPAFAERMVTWAGVGGIVGARLFYLISFPTELMERPLATIFGGAGFVFYGGFFGGAFAVWLLVRKQRMDFWQLADLTAAPLAIGYAIGRIGCQLSGDGDYGAPSALAWAIGYPLGVVPTPLGLRVHPTPVYETFGALAIAGLLVWMLNQGKLGGRGQLFGVYLLLSALARFLVEIIRVEPRVIGPLTQAQIESLIVLIVGTLLLKGIAARKRPIAQAG
jgi:phosphatidylglycerol:prolipoprotein diacylglycerol transferase